MIIDVIDADFAADASGVSVSWRRSAAAHVAFAARRGRDLAPDKPPRFAYTSASVEPQRVVRIA